MLVCCYFGTCSKSDCCIRIFSSPFQMLDICKAQVLYPQYLHLCMRLFLIWGLFVSSQLCLCFFSFFIPDSPLSLVVSSISFCTLVPLLFWLNLISSHLLFQSLFQYLSFKLSGFLISSPTKAEEGASSENVSKKLF